MIEKDWREWEVERLPELAQSCREEIEKVCHQNGGHLGGSLGVVELTIALEKVFLVPENKIIFDVGHQSYTHKLLTDRAERFATLRQKHGVSGFMNPEESRDDPCFTGHAGNSISLALGLSYGLTKNCWVIAVIGDGSVLNGMAVEALNHLATTKQKVLVVINDNRYSIDKCVGKIAESENYTQFCQSLSLPVTVVKNGHDMKELVETLGEIKKGAGPQVLYVRTEKGHGDARACACPEENHFVSSEASLAQKREKLQDGVGALLRQIGEKEPKMVVVTPAMARGGGLQDFAQRWPERFFDVGIAEEHAAALAAGLALSGKKVYAHFYATFLQRAYDQLVHDVSLNKAKVTLLVDRWGLVGEDGVTHQGNLAMSYLSSIANMEILLPGNMSELKSCLDYSLKTKGPLAIGYPKVCLPAGTLAQPIANENIEAKKLREGKNKKLAVITVGWTRETVENLPANLQFDHYHLVQVKPLPKKLLKEIWTTYQKILIVEENQLTGGFGQQAVTYGATLNGQKTPKVFLQTLPDAPLTQAHRTEQLIEAGLDGASLEKIIRSQTSAVCD